MYITDYKQVENRLIREINLSLLPSPEIQNVGLLGSEESSCNARRSNSIWDDHDKEVSENNAAKKGSLSKTTTALIAIKEYRLQDIASRDTNPLVWWKEKENCNPLLKPLVPVMKKFLTITATSCSSEELFSVAGEVDAAKRNRLAPENLDMILFLNKNT